jgi:hypothetical protein
VLADSEGDRKQGETAGGGQQALQHRNGGVGHAAECDGRRALRY